MAHIITIVSGKGGMGKTTITACLGAGLAKRGKSVLVVDGDFGLRDLDLVLGKQDDVVFNALDAIEDDTVLDAAIVKVAKNFHLLPASQSHGWEDVRRKKFKKLIQIMSEQYDYIILDGPAGLGKGARTLLGLANTVLVTTEPLWVPLRNAGRVVQYLQGEGIRDYGIVFNATHPISIMDDEIQDMLQHIGATVLAGIIPYAPSVVKYTQDGKLHELHDRLITTGIDSIIRYIAYGATDDNDDIPTLDSILGSDKEDDMDYDASIDYDVDEEDTAYDTEDDLNDATDTPLETEEVEMVEVEDDDVAEPEEQEMVEIEVDDDMEPTIQAETEEETEVVPSKPRRTLTDVWRSILHHGRLSRWRNR